MVGEGVVIQSAPRSWRRAVTTPAYHVVAGEGPPSTTSSCRKNLFPPNGRPRHPKGCVPHDKDMDGPPARAMTLHGGPCVKHAAHVSNTTQVGTTSAPLSRNRSLTATRLSATAPYEGGCFVTDRAREQQYHSPGGCPPHHPRTPTTPRTSHPGCRRPARTVGDRAAGLHLLAGAAGVAGLAHRAVASVPRRTGAWPTTRGCSLIRTSPTRSSTTSSMPPEPSCRAWRWRWGLR